MKPCIALYRLLLSIALAAFLIGCSGSDENTEQSPFPATGDKTDTISPTPDDLAFGKLYGATWVTTNSLPSQTTLTVDFQDALFSKGSVFACNLWVDDVQRKDGVLILTGTSLATPCDFKIGITTNMLPVIRAAGGRASFVRVAFRVNSVERTEPPRDNSADDVSENYSVSGKAVGIESSPDMQREIDQVNQDILNEARQGGGN
jgi:hypothetical protein